MYRGQPGQEVHFGGLRRLSDGQPFDTPIVVLVKRSGHPIVPSLSPNTMSLPGFYTFHPAAEETDADTVTLYPVADDLMSFEKSYEPRQGIVTPSPSLVGRSAVSKLELLGMIQAMTPTPGTSVWVSALLEYDPVPVTPELLVGLHRAFPKLFTINPL